jgi:hypothetical protein
VVVDDGRVGAGHVLENVNGLCDALFVVRFQGGGEDVEDARNDALKLSLRVRVSSLVRPWWSRRRTMSAVSVWSTYWTIVPRAVKVDSLTLRDSGSAMVFSKRG